MADFNFSVAATDESCAGNGSISMMVSGTTVGATLTYTLYLYPDVSTPIAQTSASAFNNLTSGHYLVIATQTLGNQQNTQSEDATINDTTTDLDFEIAQVATGNCDAANLTVIVHSGNPVSYEIISGPVTVPPQTSNTFNDLPEGTYLIRIYDTCNNALTKTYTIVLNNNHLILGGTSLPTLLDNCDEVDITNVITAQNEGSLAYPISINYTIFPPDGSPSINSSHTYTTGPEFELQATQTVGIYGSQLFDIQIVATDNCGNTISITNQIDPNPMVIISTDPGFCGKNLNIKVVHFLPPYTMEFTEAPIDFDPEALNDIFPGPYTNSVNIFGQEDASVPYGVYTVEVTDACGRTGTTTYEVEEEPIDPIVTPSNNGCSKLTVEIPNTDIISAIFTEVPDSYGGLPPIDISNHIINGVLLVNGLPPGNYVLELIDECGKEYTLEFTIPESTEEPPSVLSTPNCATQTGTLRIASATGNITSVVITEAPALFTETLPYDYSAQIFSSGIFYTPSLPEGTYTIVVSDDCGNEYIIMPFIAAYQSNPSIYNLQRNCGSFDVSILDLDESVYDQTYWFQRFFPETNTWGHPYTGVPYTEGEMPNSSNAIEIENEETLFNIFLFGTFRLIKAFQPYNNPTPGLHCYDVFAEFEVSSDLIINGIYNLNCEGGSGPSNVLVDVIGVEPLNFSIVSPITLDNGTNNTFTDLSPGTYEIKVEDACGSIETIIVNLEDILPIVNIFTPTDIVVCSDNGSNQSLFDLSQQNPQLLGTQNPENYTITYHLNQDDADSGNNPLPENYENNDNPQTIYARVIHNTLNVCYATSSFQLIVGSPPQLNPNETISICDGSSVTLSATSGYDGYLWSTGETTSSIEVSNSGEYTVTVSESYGDFYCDASQTFSVFVSGLATIETTSTEDWTTNNNTISIEVSGLGEYEYSLDGISYQPEPYFSNLQTGEYTIYVRDRNGCGIITKEVYLLNYMKFFTPNGDGENEVWQILGAPFEPDLQVTIFDRYGKTLNSFTGNDPGWNGSYNGHNMPSNDYWFVVKRANGKTYKGHFTLKR
ncbi:MAG: T9SS type B sorting domain-containing protein [Gelidibacter sp.]